MTNQQFCRIWVQFYAVVEAHRSELNDLDAAIGDADHGTNMARGLARVREYCATSEDSLSAACKKVGMTLLSTVGGASGALWGSALMRASSAFPDAGSCDSHTAVMALKTGIQAIMDRGKARRGDKTMLDVWLPALERLEQIEEQNQDMNAGLQEVATMVGTWADNTVPLEAKRGRAAYLGPRSVGHMDPGALSTALWWRVVAEEAQAE